MAKKRARRTAKTTTPAQDRLLALLRKRGKLTRAQALRAVSAGTVSRALAAGKLVKVCSGRRVSCIEARTADVRTHHVVMDVRREAVRGVPGGRLAAMSALLSGAGRTPRERAWGLTGPLPPGLRSAASLRILVTSFTRTCAPTAWSDWLKTIHHFRGGPRSGGRAAEIDAVVDLWVAETNRALETSGVRHRVALVGRAENQFDGIGDAARALRERVGADLYTVIPTHEQSGGSHAELGGPQSVVTIGRGSMTFAHELGHNMGLQHERYQTHHRQYGTKSHPVYGYVNQAGLAPGAAASRRWRTLMAYGTRCDELGISCPRLFRFSNSRQRHRGDPLGVPFGTGGSGATGPADAAAVLDVTMPEVARWRDRPLPNRPPTAVGALPDRTLPLPGSLTVDVSRAFADPDGDPLTYAVSSSSPDVVTVTAVGARLTLTAVSNGAATIRVTATDPGGLSASQSFAVTVTDGSSVPFTDDPVRPGVTPVRAVHFTELRTRIDGLRQTAGLAPFGWTDPVLRAGATPVRLVHLLELRQALTDAYRAAGRTPPSWTDAAPAAGTTPVRAVHITELRAAVTALE